MFDRGLPDPIAVQQSRCPATTKKKETELTDNAFDPFDEIAADETVEETPPAKKAAPKKAAAKVEQGDDGRWTVTLKGGAGFDAPWLVGRFASLEEASDEFSGDRAALLVGLMERVKQASNKFTGGQQSAPRSGGAPAGAVEPPPGTPAAPGPDWTYKTGVGKTGKPWKAWMPPRGSNEQPVWL